MEDVPSAGCILAVHHKCGRVGKLAVHQRERAVRAQSHGGDAHAVFVLQRLKRFEGVALIGPLGGEFGTGHKVVHVRQNFIEAVINRIDVDGNRDAVFAGDRRRARHGGRVVSINVQQPRAEHLFFGDLFWSQAQAIGPAPKHGPLSGGLIDHDIGRLVGATLSYNDVIDVDACALEAFQLNAAAFIVPHCADVFHFESERRAGHHGACDLPAGTENLIDKWRFAGISGEMRNDHERICSIEPDAEHVELGHIFLGYRISLPHGHGSFRAATVRERYLFI